MGLGFNDNFLSDESPYMEGEVNDREISPIWYLYYREIAPNLKKLTVLWHFRGGRYITSNVPHLY
jgi:hypothetical protein